MSDEQELFQIVRRQHVWSSVVDQIRELIDSGRLKPGDRLPSERQRRKPAAQTSPEL